MLTACSQDQYTIYKGSFLSNLLCRWCDGRSLVLAAWISSLSNTSSGLPAIAWGACNECHLPTPFCPLPLPSQMPWQMAGLRLRTRVSALYSCQHSAALGVFVQYKFHLSKVSLGWCNDYFKMRWELLSVSLALYETHSHTHCFICQEST